MGSSQWSWSQSLLEFGRKVNSSRGTRKGKGKNWLALRLDSLPFHDGDVAVDAEAGEAFGLAAWLRPLDIEAVHFGVWPKTEDFARIMGGKVTSPSHFEPVALEIASLIGDESSDGVRVGRLTDKPHAQPMILLSGVILEEHGRGVIDGNQDVHGAVVVEISDGHPAGGERLRKNRAGSVADVLETLSGVLE